MEANDHKNYVKYFQLIVSEIGNWRCGVGRQKKFLFLLKL